MLGLKERMLFDVSRRRAQVGCKESIVPYGEIKDRLGTVRMNEWLLSREIRIQNGKGAAIFMLMVWRNGQCSQPIDAFKCRLRRRQDSCG